ncbi:MAG: M20/M25/M40 family metallo-hydrolase, partial [Oscillospiraceae bacterium]|nr:M20/M25/M40 family metallo-hydrolase [Oscillospiraceae bacterium]
MLWLIIPAAILIFAAVLLIRAAAFKPAAEEKYEEDPIDLDRERIVETMQQMIRCKTVSNRDLSLVEETEFEKFRALLEERYPLIHKTATLTRHGNSGILYHIPGKSAEKASVCMAHYDVVPVVEEMWTVPAFDGLVKDGCIWGRGTLDTKGTLCGLMEALEKMLSDGFIPANDLYLSFSGDEEVDGLSCPAIVSYLEQKGIRPFIVVDEGGAVVENVFPGVKRECAVVGIAEKGGLNYDLVIEGAPGHASTPPPRQSVGKLGRAIVAIENKPFPSRLTKPAAEMFDTLGRHSTFLYRLIFANLWCFKGVLDMICKSSGGELNAL